MKTRFLCAAIILSVCGGGGFAADWKAGTARAVITPTEPMYLAGFASREVPAEGTAMDLHAKALAMEDPNGIRFVMVTLDLVEVTHQLRDAVAAEVTEKFGLPPETLLLNCSGQIRCITRLLRTLSRKTSSPKFMRC